MRSYFKIDIINIVFKKFKNFPGIESLWGAKFSAPVNTSPMAHPASSYIADNGSVSQGKSGRGVALTTLSHLAPRLKKE
jgi:hypothetical protein